MSIPAPIGLLAELTHRCPLQCPYCSNPVGLDRKSGELDTATWKRVFSEAAVLGILQVHLSGGEPTARPDLAEIVAHCRSENLYTNLITSGVLLGEKGLQALYDAGLDHVQLSFQDVEAANADRIGGYRGGHEKKLRLAAQVVALGLPLTVNAVIHRQNIASTEAFVEFAVRLGARRVEIAHTQYYGWALANRDALMPTHQQALDAVKLLEDLRRRYDGIIVIDAVVPDYYARFPKACVGGWGRRVINVTPKGKVLPCHAAETIPGLVFDTVKDKALEDIWRDSAAFNAYRGTDWMPEPCQSCERKEVDWGGCRCQAMALTGAAENADPACSLSAFNSRMRAIAGQGAMTAAPEFRYRRFDG
ncbi:pyrroloquinoline quinone biosynthesis protein PqqE [soil metagenome]